MVTYRECVFMVLDALKINSDDSVWEPDHIIFMLNKYRALLLKQRYSHYRVDVPLPYFQSLDIKLEPDLRLDYLKSIKPLPNILNLNGIELETTISAYPLDYSFNLVTIDRLKYVGENKYLKNSIYCAIDYSDHLLIKYPGRTEPLEYVEYDALLENPLDIIEFNELGNINPLDYEFPVEAAALSDIIGLCVKELSSYNYLPENKTNNAVDDTPTGIKTK